MHIGYLRMKIQLPGCRSLKEKRGRIKPILARVRKAFNVAAAEVDYHDVWRTAGIGITTLSTDPARVQRCLQAVPRWIENHWPDLLIETEEIEMR